MKATDMLNRVKELVGVEASEETQEVKLAQATLENGTVIESETFEAGSEVFIVTEEEKVALPIGEYTLEDGEILTVEEEGIIASIGAAVEEEAPAEEEASEEVKAEEEEQEMAYATKEELAELKSMVAPLKDSPIGLSTLRTVSPDAKVLASAASEYTTISTCPQSALIVSITASFMV